MTGPKQARNGEDVLNKKVVARMCCLNFGLAFLNIILFSKMFAGISLTEDTPLRRAAGFTVLIMSVLLFLYGNYKLMKSPQAKYDYTTMELVTPADLLDALEDLRSRTALRPQLETVISQIRLIKGKKENLKAVIYHKFREEDEDALGFKDVVENTEKLLYANAKQVINAAAAFDQKEFQRLERTRAQHPERFQIYMEQINYIKGKVSQNEKVLLEYDRLIMEVSKLSDGSEESAENLKVLESVVDSLRQM